MSSEVDAELRLYADCGVKAATNSYTLLLLAVANSEDRAVCGTTAPESCGPKSSSHRLGGYWSSMVSNGPPCCLCCRKEAVSVMTTRDLSILTCGCDPRSSASGQVLGAASCLQTCPQPANSQK